MWVIFFSFKINGYEFQVLRKTGILFAHGVVLEKNCQKKDNVDFKKLKNYGNQFKKNE